MPARTSDISRNLNKKRGRRYRIDHSEAAFLHAQKRAKERYGRKLTWEEHTAITASLRAGRAQEGVDALVFVHRHQESEWFDCFLPTGEVFRVVWNHAKGLIVSVLPPSCREIPARMRAQA